MLGSGESLGKNSFFTGKNSVLTGRKAPGVFGADADFSVS